MKENKDKDYLLAGGGGVYAGGEAGVLGTAVEGVETGAGGGVYSAGEDDGQGEVTVTVFSSSVLEKPVVSYGRVN